MFVKILKVTAGIFVSAVLLSGCENIIVGKKIYAGQWFCFSHEDLEAAKRAEMNDWLVHTLTVNGAEIRIYEGSGFAEIEQPTIYKSKNGWTWEYGEEGGVVVLEHNKKIGNPPQLDIRFNVSNRSKISVKDLAESFQDMPKNGKCRNFYLK